jgi:hypothetical protein
LAIRPQALRRGVFHSGPDLVAKIDDYLAAHNNVNNPGFDAHPLSREGSSHHAEDL